MKPRGVRLLSSSDVEEPMITVTDVKQFLFCPRVVYFKKVMAVDPKLDSQQVESGRRHLEMERRERRRAAAFYSQELKDAEKTFRVALASKTLGLHGILDCLVKTGSEYIPVDYKFMESKGGKPYIDHKYQLVAYAMLVEETFKVPVRRGYIYYVPEDRIVEVKVTHSMKIFLRKVITRIHRMLESGKLPQVKVSRRKCGGGCGYLWICKSI